ncbi:MAG: rhodanese-like protein [Aeromicrobium sp.]|nr:rhodanese-like protein [Aeromicrobium sp.]
MTAWTSTADRSVLVEAEWLAEHLFDPAIRVVEVDVSPTAYQDWHIDGAVLWNIYTDLKDSNYRLVDTPSVEALLTRSGIEPDSTVVFYGYGPALGFWLLTLYGHADVRILNCSREAWHSSGHPRSTSATAAPPTRARYELGPQDLELRADLDMVSAAITDPSVTLVDVRSAAEYAGERFWPSGAIEPRGRAGRVPSAIHQPLEGLHDDQGAFLPPEELRRVLAPTPLNGREELITYCTIGGRAATAWFVLTYLLGRTNVRVYDGSWAEWGRQPSTPVQSDNSNSPGGNRNARTDS